MSEPGTTSERSVALRVVGVSRRFGDVLALADVDLEIRRGEVLAILGENGAGKTTLMRILSGLDQPSRGQLFRGEERYQPRSPREAVEQGVALVQQHFALVHTMTAAENILLFRSQPERRTSREQAASELRALGAELAFDIDPDTKVADLSVGERQRLELLRALDADPEILLLDEPTAVLTDAEADSLLEVIRRLATDGGRAVVLITHRLREVVNGADRVMVLRNGEVVSPASPVGGRSVDQLAHEMVGGDIPAVAREGASRGEVMVSVDDLTVGRLQSAHFDVHEGEVLGIAGVDGNGQVELELAMAGLAVPTRGRIMLRGDDIARRSPRQRTAGGIAYIPSDRHTRALVGPMRCDENLLLGRTRRRLRADPGAGDLMTKWAVKGGLAHLADSLSGGNAQKLVCARELREQPHLVLACQPTRGLDPGAAGQLRQALLDFADEGGAVVWMSADLDELLEVSDRIRVMFHGGLSDPFESPFDRRAIGLAMAGVS